MFGRVDEFIRDANSIQTRAALADLLEAMTRDMGFAYFALTHHTHPSRDTSIRLANYPLDWVEYFDANGLGASDPVHRASHMTSVGFVWSNLPGLIDLTPRDPEVLALAERRGIGDGFTIPAHVPGEATGSCSFATAHGQALDPDQLPLAQLVGAFAFEAARRVWEVRQPASDPRPRLTDRQRDCVIWAARGKSDWEILDVRRRL